MMPIDTRSLTRVDLAHLFASLGYRSGAEIGTWMGEYSEQLCLAIPGVHLLCVDPWRAYKGYREDKNNQDRLDAAYRAATDRLAPYRCSLLRMASVDAAAHVADGSLDFVYIDANHSEPFVTQDLEAWTPKVR